MRIIKVFAFLLFLSPFLLLLFDILNENLIDPIEEITNPTGKWALKFLLITLSITPVVHFTKQRWLMRLRRMLGVFTFFYACLHLSIYLIDQTFDAILIFEDVVKRTYITIGFSAFLLMVPLAITSTNGWIKRLGRRWKKLHRFVYIIAPLGVIHFYWQSKSDMVVEPFIYASVLVLLLVFRLWRHYR